MLIELFQNADLSRYALLGCFLLSFVGTILILGGLQNFLPRDAGRAFAVNGEKSKGKPRGAGIVFILVFAVLALLLLPVEPQTVIYLSMTVAAMLTGYLDDASKNPWGRLRKGLLDLVIAGVCAVTYINFNGASFQLLPGGATITLHPVLFAVLAVFLIFVSINVVNCTDGVDGLCGTLAIISLLSYAVVFYKLSDTLESALCVSLLLCLMGYLWYNASPSKLMMGDAGSRAIGLFLAVVSLQCGAPLLFLPLSLVFVLDGGLGLFKILLIKTFHRPMLSRIRTPLHDHARKVSGWSDPQTVFRFAILQVVLSGLTLYLLFAA